MGDIHIAIVGAPSTGKSTLIDALEKKGHKVIHEVSRDLIIEQKNKGGSILPWINRDLFQKEMLKRQIIRRKEFEGNKLIFSDTGIPCGIAYYLADDLTPPKELFESAKLYSYERVFILDFLPSYEEDGLRIENKEESQKIHFFLEKIYRDLGNKIVKVPFMEVNERVKFIEDNLDDFFEKSEEKNG